MTGGAGRARGFATLLVLVAAAPAVGQGPAPDAFAPFLAVFDRAGWGPFCIWTSNDTGGRLPEYRAFPTSVWQGGTRRLVDEPGHAALVYDGCKLNGIEGDFDFAVHLRAAADRSVDGVTSRMKLAPTLRATLLPGARPAETAWWETLEAYRAFAMQQGLLNATRLQDKRVPSGWAQQP